MRRWRVSFFFISGAALAALSAAPAPEENSAALPAPLRQPLSLERALNLGLTNNADLAKARSDLEATHGVIIQTRAVALPKAQINGNYQATTQIEKFPAAPVFGSQGFNAEQEQSWAVNLRIVQSIYEGGRLRSALRAAKHTKEQAIDQYEAAVQDALLSIQVAYNDALLAAQQIKVQEASVQLLEQEVADQKRRFDAGTVPRFNVLRAEVELANAQPRLIRARNDYRIAKNNLVRLLGFDLPREVWEDIPLRLSGQLVAEPFFIELPVALGKAVEDRPELRALQQEALLRNEAITQAKAGYKPRFDLFGGYGARSPFFTPDLAHDIAGWNGGAEMSWDLFDGFLTRGKIKEARARRQKAAIELADTRRRIELEVRTAYSNFNEAKEVLESQKLVQAEAEEALRLARARAEAGAATQLDVLSAQTDLTQARTTQIQALHDYAVALARLQRAIGENLYATAPSGAALP